jgi:hypothetical protein
MKQINCNVSGTPTDTPTISDDVPRSFAGHFETGNLRCVFELPDDAIGGGHLHFRGQTVNFLLPGDSGSFEGSRLGLPTMVYASPLGLTIADVQFVTIATGKRWLMKGTTEMNAPDRLRSGENIRPVLRQRVQAGANLVRSLGMGYPFRTNQSPLPFALVEQYFELCAQEELYVQWCVFAGTRLVMPNQSQQLEFWQQSIEVCKRHQNVLIELCNEFDHSSQSISPAAFPKPSGILASRGSALTDETPAKPHMDWAGYSARRDTNNSRGFTNCDPYEFESDFPKREPMIAQESAKPEDYGFDRRFAALIGKHGANGWGIVFHSNQGVRSELWPENVLRCAEACYAEVR